MLCLAEPLEGSMLEEVSFNYLGSIIDKQGGTDADVKVRISKKKDWQQKQPLYSSRASDTLERYSNKQ